MIFGERKASGELVWIIDSWESAGNGVSSVTPFDRNLVPTISQAEWRERGMLSAYDLRCRTVKLWWQYNGEVLESGALMRILHSALSSTSKVRCIFADENGAAMVEFALISPLLIMILALTISFSLAILNYATMYLAAGTGAQVITTERLNSSSSSWTPYTDTVGAVKAASAILSPTILGTTGNIVVSINGTACTSDTACQLLLTAITTSGSTVAPASVKVIYPCDPLSLTSTFTVLWWSFGSCNFTATITGVVQ